MIVEKVRQPDPSSLSLSCPTTACSPCHLPIQCLLLCHLSPTVTYPMWQLWLWFQPRTQPSVSGNSGPSQAAPALACAQALDLVPSSNQTATAVAALSPGWDNQQLWLRSQSQAWDWGRSRYLSQIGTQNQDKASPPPPNLIISTLSRTEKKGKKTSKQGSNCDI